LESEATSGTWMDVLDERQQQHVLFCRTYADHFKHGAPGHLDMLVIAALAELLDKQGPLVVIERVAPDAESQEASEDETDDDTGPHVSVFLGGLSAEELNGLSFSIHRNEAS
jgi:hypothetical protein